MGGKNDVSPLPFLRVIRIVIISVASWGEKVTFWLKVAIDVGKLPEFPIKLINPRDVTIPIPIIPTVSTVSDED